jgi:urease accessory protein
MNLDPALDLTFRAAPDGATVLARRRVRYPFSVQAAVRDVRGRPSAARVFVQSASGGIFAGETIGQRVDVLQRADLVVEMPAATVVHAMRDGRTSRQRIELLAEAGSRLEFLPRPLILFPCSRLGQTIEVTADDEARMLIGDGFMMHDPAAVGEAFDRFDGRIVARRPDGAVVLDDRASATGAAMQAELPGVGGRYMALGSLLLLAPLADAVTREACRMLHAQLQDLDGVYGGATPLRRQAGLLVRMLAVDGGSLADAQAALAVPMRQLLLA